jgi:hypothetical protein
VRLLTNASLSEETGKSPTRLGRARVGFAVAAASSLMAVSLVAGAGPAGASRATLPPDLAKFAHCPVSKKAVTTCLAAAMTGTFQINSTTVTLTKPALISLGLISHPDGSFTVVLPRDGTPALKASPASIPGLPGLVGITAQPKLVGLPTFNLANLFTMNGPAIVLPIDVKLGGNVVLGSSCTIGDPSNPITLNLTDGTTNPPWPNTAITGALGTVVGLPNGVINITGSTLVDNAFAVPGAANCGLLGVLDPIINLAEGLPSPAGKNSDVMSGSSSTAPASLIRQYIP